MNANLRLLITSLALWTCPVLQAQEPVDEVVLADWIAQEIQAPVDTGHASAVAAAVVQGGEVLHAAAYGWSDPVAGVKVGQHSQFKIGSITKTFGGLAAAQLLDKGLLLSLDDPANNYLNRYKLPGEWGSRVTIAHLLTHAAGLDSPALGITGNDQEIVPADAQFLQARIPRIVRKPGTRIVYANYGLAVVQALIEDVSGQRYDSYLTRNILEPLGMTGSRLEMGGVGGPTLVRAGRTLPGEGGRALEFLPLGTNAPFVAASGSMQLTARDMARYINAQLGHAPDVVTQGMIASQQSKVRSNYPGLDSLGLALFAKDWNGIDVWSHGGLVAGFRSSVAFVPEYDVGVFVVFAGGDETFGSSGGSAGGAVDKLLREVLGSYRPPPESTSSDKLDRYVGAYWTQARAHDTPDVMLSLLQVNNISFEAPDSLFMDGQPLVEVAPGLFRFVEADSELPARFFALTGSEIRSSADYRIKVSGLGNPTNWLRILVVGSVLCITGLAGLFYPGYLRLSMVVGGLAAIGFLWMIVKHMLGPDALFDIFTGEIQWRFAAGRWFAWGLILSGVGSLIGAVVQWRRQEARLSRWAAVHAGMAGTGALAVAWVLFKLNYFQGVFD